jgi:hypothetical protein
MLIDLKNNDHYPNFLQKNSTSTGQQVSRSSGQQVSRSTGGAAHLSTPPATGSCVRCLAVSVQTISQNL